MFKFISATALLARTSHSSRCKPGTSSAGAAYWFNTVALMVAGLPGACVW